MYILGISAYYHDSAAVIICDEEIIEGAQEALFTRKKQDIGFPSNAIHYCLKDAGISLSEIDWIVFYEKPFLKLFAFFSTLCEGQ